MTSEVQRRADCLALELAIRDKWRLREWYRSEGRRLFGHRWDDLAVANRRDLTLLVRRLRRARAEGGYWRARGIEA